ncbi:thiamine phosphate synthase [Lutimaribacter sp. EGI FJ00015]|uniref:Thiamine phosphate synthase n=1 Tax=Lutimaribacter degradans TaxID=2945989 RepID=A0ACC6A124_9RHOB|nr:thiamine phosphate synthase [Lutimaribacter sp. EGI FJ00013]MCM2563691.1 thiamine phosphate synthase [Lutimaribacter sp. EGI FJ00013]MCO0614875.1 thiamine phosphate synthase [Lutimaribacter sp. EGI FJ00015]MCO0637543.1 thiamine phosphate synthase [Lutimaribacter sp. EGI FJ00014]
MIYFVTPDGCDDALVRAALVGGAGMIQIRDKTATDAEMVAQARRLLPLCRDAGVPLIINDRLSVALESGADGLHMGQGDGDPAQARVALGTGVHLGLSIETAAQLAAMPAGAISLIGAGPVHATSTKPDHAAPLGLDGLAHLVAQSAVPAVAIGGVGLPHIPALKQAGCAGIAVVSAIASAPDPETATRELVTAWRYA